MLELPRTLRAYGHFAATAVALLACNADQGTTPSGSRVPTLRIVAGANVSDTIDAKPLQALVVEVRDSLGKPMRGAVVRFDALRETQTGMGSSILVASLRSQFFATFLADSTDAEGRAYALVALGTAAGPARIAISVPAIGRADTASYTVVPGAATRIRLIPSDTALTVGKRLSLSAASADRYNNPRSDALSFVSASSACTIDATGLVEARSIGRCTIGIRSAVATDSGHVTVVPQADIAGVRIDLSGAPPAVITMALDGANVRTRALITTYDAFPATTSDGLRIVYRDREHLHIVLDSLPVRRLLAAAEQLSWEGWPRFSADRTWIYFAGGDATGNFLYRVRPDGSGFERILPPTGSGTAPDPSPDGTTLAYTGDELIRVMSLDKTQAVTTFVRGTQPRWSPSGDRIAFFHAGGVHVIDANGSNLRQVTPPGRVYDDYAGLDWSADAKWIIARSVVTIDLINVATGEVLPLPFPHLYQPVFVR